MRPLTSTIWYFQRHVPEYCARPACHSIFQLLHCFFSSRATKPLTGDIGSPMSAAVTQKRPIRFAAIPPERVNSQVPGCMGLESASAGAQSADPKKRANAGRIEEIR